MLAFLCFLFMSLHQVFSKDAAVSKIKRASDATGFPQPCQSLCGQLFFPLRSPEERFAEVDRAEVKINFSASQLKYVCDQL